MNESERLDKIRDRIHEERMVDLNRLVDIATKISNAQPKCKDDRNNLESASRMIENLHDFVTKSMLLCM